MSQVGTLAVKRLAEMLGGQTGISAGISAVAAKLSISAAGIPAPRIVAINIASEVVEKSAGTQYPSIHVYCERLANQLREKFRTFSGTARMAMDIRVTHDRLDGIANLIQLYADAATEVLDTHRGDWGQGMFFPGSYELTYGTVKHGGKNFIQTAKLTFDLEVSR